MLPFFQFLGFQCGIKFKHSYQEMAALDPKFFNSGLLIFFHINQHHSPATDFIWNIWTALFHLGPSVLSQGGSTSGEVCCTIPETLFSVILRTGKITWTSEHVVYSCALSHPTTEQSDDISKYLKLPLLAVLL